jgi:putative inorganic carbon (hco3(-)) transporter
VLKLIKEHIKEFVLIAVVLLYIAANMIFTYHSFYLLNLLPVVLVIAYLTFTRLDIIYFVLIALTPLSIPLLEFVKGTTIDFYLPTEPILFGVLLIVIFKSVRHNFIDKKILLHPVSIAIIINLFWIFITSITSSMPIVSFKFLLARMWFVCSFYLLAIHLFKKPKKIKGMIWAYTLPLLIVIAYAWSRQFIYGTGFNDTNAAHFVMNPFYRDHTSYGAVLAMIIFPYIGMNLKAKYSFLKGSVVFTIGLILFFALIFSYTRAAWISVLASLSVLAVIKLRIKFKYVLILISLGFLLLYSNQEFILKSLESNKQDSSGNIAEHVQSISNIATDASNLERINRWASAMRMFKERPIFGWGPGTYMFQYAPFQLSSQRTTISTDFGDLGNAHSEYIGSLSESGIIGFLSFLLVVVVSIITAFKVYGRIINKRMKRLVLSLILGFITYLLHGTLNNFLDTDKASALFWGFIAAFVALDIYYKEKTDKEALKEKFDGSNLLKA